ncbi:hypothetical protein [Nonomuraea insulae]|uniref:TetR family transcriptional regulator n=1 Tax=Nonomuraea insulae TaxID=1616787 RepID=A0ABW1CXF8_9ACTN
MSVNTVFNYFSTKEDLFAGIVNGSQALLARMRQIQVERERGLARALADELDADPDDLTPAMAAACLLTTMRILSDHALAMMRAGEPWERIEPLLRAQADSAFDLLEAGLGSLGALVGVAGEGAADDGQGQAESHEGEGED